MTDGRDLALLAALRLGDAFLPTGAYTLSHGLESMVQMGWVTDARGLEEALTSYVAEQLAPADGVAVAASHRTAGGGDVGEVIEIDRYLAALKMTREPREGTQRAGRNLLRVLVETSDHPVLAAYSRAVSEGRAPGNHAVALGAGAYTLGLSAREAVLVYLYSSSVSLLGAALRLMRVDHLETQRILARLGPLLGALAGECEARPWRSMRSFGPQWEIASILHERATVRLFSS